MSCQETGGPKSQVERTCAQGVISLLIQASSHSHFSSPCQYHMMGSSQKGPQRAKQITQMEIMTTLIKRWRHHPALTHTEQRKPPNISFSALRSKHRAWATHDVPLDDHLLPAVSGPLAFGLHYHQTTGLTGVTEVGKDLRNAASQGTLRTGCSKGRDVAG